MALTEQVKFYVGILDNGVIELRKTRVITDTVSGDTFDRNHRQVFEPGQDVTSQPAKIRNICALIWTPQVIADYVAWKASQPPLGG